MATGTPGRRYWVEVFDVQTFHARRQKVDVRAAPAVALELGGRPPRDVVRAELVALLVELRGELGAGVGLHLLPVSGRDMDPSVFREAVALAGERLYWRGSLRAVSGDYCHESGVMPPIAVDASVLNDAGELVGTTCQAAR